MTFQRLSPLDVDTALRTLAELVNNGALDPCDDLSERQVEVANVVHQMWAAEATQDEGRFSVWYALDNSGADGLTTFDEAVAWAQAAVARGEASDEDNYCGVYDGVDTERIAVVSPSHVAVNTGHGTERWPAGYNDNTEEH